MFSENPRVYRYGKQWVCKLISEEEKKGWDAVLANDSLVPLVVPVSSTEEITDADGKQAYCLTFPFIGDAFAWVMDNDIKMRRRNFRVFWDNLIGIVNRFHKKGLVFCDAALENFLVEKNQYGYITQVFVCDLDKVRHHTQLTGTKPGRSKYTFSAFLNKEEDLTFEELALSDQYAVYIIALEFLTGGAFGDEGSVRNWLKEIAKTTLDDDNYLKFVVDGLRSIVRKFDDNVAPL